ncbi:hypothetical protein ElyMa_005274300 [Elysia marginata]|uniref:Pacifastin domain-containing protein n=1 Tax=Elysia marginata TaxID=1093978 RepID=A0AAV4K0I7_9GAST|nr:hypothetical protein ElyMa_005274300 [Elysia marginata]
MLTLSSPLAQILAFQSGELGREPDSFPCGAGAARATRRIIRHETPQGNSEKGERCPPDIYRSASRGQSANFSDCNCLGCQENGSLCSPEQTGHQERRQPARDVM